MTRSELIIKLAARFPQLIAQDAEASVKIILEAITDSLATGGRVEVRGFGSFTVHTRPPRLGRNPKTGEPVPVPAKHVPHFKAGVELRERVNAACFTGKGLFGAMTGSVMKEGDIVSPLDDKFVASQ